MRALLVLLLYTILSLPAAFSQDSLQPVPGFPPQQVYDLLVDRKGYLWIGHELGITRYDGLSYTLFSNPNEASLGMTDLVEDRFGRIWCHNFSSQIFYIENEQMHWLKEYDYLKENQFPRMILKGDELVVSSNQGMFVCNIVTFKSRYLPSPHGRRYQTNYLTLLKDRIVAYNVGTYGMPNECYVYETGKGVKQMKWDPVELGKIVPVGYWALQPHTYNDTIYVSGDPRGTLLKLMVHNDSLVAVGQVQVDDFVNSITKDGNRLWLHSRKASYSNTGQRIYNLNVSDVVTGPFGNTWVGSVSQGLLMKKQTSDAIQVNVQGLEATDFVRSITLGATTILLGTQNGKLIVLDKKTQKTLYTHTLPFKTSGIDIVKVLSGDTYLFNTSMAPYIIDARSRKVQPMDVKVLMKDVDVTDSVLLLGTLSGLIMHPSPLKPTASNWYEPMDTILRSIDYIKEYYWLFTLKRGRCNAVAYDWPNRSILASFKDGVYELSSKGVRPLMVSGQRVYASSLKFARNKMFIATISNGLIIRDGDHISRVSINEGLSSNSIIDTKVIGNHLWLFQSDAIQVLDIDRKTILTEIDLPMVIGSTMVDVVEVNDSAIITSREGVFKVPMKPVASPSSIQTYITYILANNKDTLRGKDAVLTYNENDLQIYLSAPWYNTNQPVFFKYRLLGSGDDQWRITKENMVRFPSLMPGHYKFEAYAMHPSGKSSRNTAIFAFEVLKPWWEQWWLRILVLLLLALGFYALYRYQVSQLMKMESIRRNISSDLHDDIGATLSSINIYTELAKRQEDNREFLTLIQDNTREIIGKLDDLVWSINPKNDSAEQLINRMRSFSEPLLSGANINYKITCGEDLHKLKLDTGIKRNVYLIFKETINNVAKHSHSKNCTVDIYYQNRRLYMQIADDGVGFDETHHVKNRNGLKNIQDRARQIKANVRIDS
ncbi:MAG TPA: two-component regulator propeller domain-containing protein, partial [Chitinophagaceae bacterium]